VRKFHQGLLKELETYCMLEPGAEGGTRARYEIIARPNNFLGSIVIPIQIGRLSPIRFERIFRQMDAYRCCSPICAARHSSIK
jgi:hypothetical protein